MNDKILDDFSCMTETITTYKGAIFRDPDEEAKNYGLVAVHPCHDELQVDLDTEADYVVFQKRLCTFQKHVPIVQVRVNPSKSGLPHRHITVQLEENIESHWQRIAMQAVLGSDGNREMFNVIRTHGGGNAPSVFFELPTE